MPDIKTFSEILNHVSQDRDIPEAELKELADQFLTISKSQKSAKSRAGLALYRLIRATGNRGLERQFLRAFTPGDTDQFLRYSADRARHAASFRAYVAARTRMMKHHGKVNCAEWLLWNKANTPRFAEKCGVKVPEVKALCPLADITFAERTVIKPFDSGNGQGVYLLFSEDRIFDTHLRVFFSGWDELHKRLEADLAAKRNHRDEWLVEQLVVDDAAPGSLARDIKFFMFYGEIALIQVIERHPQVNEVWLNGDFEPIKPGPKLRGAPPEGWHLSEDELQAARDFSLKMPTPFMRVDMLVGDDGFYLGELTARPGVWHRFNRTTDLYLGDKAISADMRLTHDLLRGKSFPEYMEFREEIISEMPAEEAAQSL